MVEVNHAVPAAAYVINNGTGSIAFTGDTYINDAFWHALNEEPRMDMVIAALQWPSDHNLISI